MIEARGYRVIGMSWRERAKGVKQIWVGEPTIFDLRCQALCKKENSGALSCFSG